MPRARRSASARTNRCSGGGHFEIFIRPELAHAADAMPVQIAAILAHELVHAAVAIGLGLVGPMRTTRPGDAFLATIAPILAAAGPLPHARLDTGGETTRQKKQAVRLLKCECEVCGYTVRTAREWLETVGAPLCPVIDHGPMRHDPLNGDEDAEMGDSR